MIFPCQKPKLRSDAKPSGRSQLLDAHFVMLSAADLGEEGAKVLASQETMWKAVGKHGKAIGNHGKTIEKQ